MTIYIHIYICYNWISFTVGISSIKFGHVIFNPSQHCMHLTLSGCRLACTGLRQLGAEAQEWCEFEAKTGCFAWQKWNATLHKAMNNYMELYSTRYIYIYLYTYIYTHTYTYIYIYTYHSFIVG